jgi:hypothetical protein
MGCGWVVDIWDLRRDQGEAVAGTKVGKYANYRQLLGRKDIDGVVVADVYVKSPRSSSTALLSKSPFSIKCVVVRVLPSP